jgi:hypothetical protein
LLDLKHIAGDLLNPLGNCPPVLRLERQRFQNQEIQGALRQVNAFVCHAPPFASTKGNNNIRVVEVQG